MSSPENVSSMTRWIVTLSSASRSFFAIAILDTYPRAGVAVDKVDDILHRGSREEYALDSHLVQLGDVDVGNNAADYHQHVLQSLLPQELHQAPADVHMGA